MLFLKEGDQMKKRYILIIILIALLLPLLYFRNEMKFLSSIFTYKLTKSETKSEEILNNPFDEYIKDENSNSVETTDTNGSDIDSENTISTSEKNNTQIDNSQTSTNLNKKSLDQIITIYDPKFKALENEFNSLLDNLIKDALSDYNSGNYTKFQLARFYLDKGYKIEKESDAKFYSLVKELEKELKNNSLDLSLKEKIVRYYESVKSAKKDSLINKGMDLVNGE